MDGPFPVCSITHFSYVKLPLLNMIEASDHSVSPPPLSFPFSTPFSTVVLLSSEHGFQYGGWLLLNSSRRRTGLMLSFEQYILSHMDSYSYGVGNAGFLNILGLDHNSPLTCL